MASPAQLVQAVSAVTGIPLPTVVDIDRKLVKGKLRTKGGRGFNAAQMTALDAARLLTAVLASPQANAAVDAVARYALTYPAKAQSSDKLFGTAGLSDLAALPARHSFVDALAAIIASAATGTLATMIAAAQQGWSPSIEVVAFTRGTRGRIRIAGLPSPPGEAIVEYAPSTIGSKSRRVKNAGTSPIMTPDNSRDLEERRRVTEFTILSIARLLRDAGEL